MKTRAPKTKKNRNQSFANSVPQKRSSETAFQFVDNRATAVTQRKLQSMFAGNPRLVIQRKGTITEFMDGKVKLYIPEVVTKKAAYYCHGVYSKQIDPVKGVSLGYLAPHKSTTSANATAVGLAPNRNAEVDVNGKWHSYILTKEAIAADDDVWFELAESAKRTVAWVQSATSTEEIVSALKMAGYTDILAVHCREVMGEENIDWDPVTNAEIVVDQEGWLVDRAAMKGWKDLMNEQLDEKTPVKKDDIYYDEAAAMSRRVLVPDENGQVRICTLK